MGAPVDDTLPLVDEALVIQADKHLIDRLGAALVHGEALPLPVAGGTQLFQLGHNAPAVLLLPGPGPLEEALPAHLLLGEALLLAHILHYLGLRRDGGVVGAGHPEGVVALHPPPTDEDILHGVVQSMAHVKLPGDIGRGHDDGVGLPGFIYLGVEIALVLPEFVHPVFRLLGVVDLFQFLFQLLFLLWPMDDKKAPFVSTGISYLPETKGAVPSALPLCFALL